MPAISLLSSRMAVADSLAVGTAGTRDVRDRACVLTAGLAGTVEVAGTETLVVGTLFGGVNSRLGCCGTVVDLAAAFGGDTVGVGRLVDSDGSNGEWSFSQEGMCCSAYSVSYAVQVAKQTVRSSRLPRTEMVDEKYTS